MLNSISLRRGYPLGEGHIHMDGGGYDEDLRNRHVDDMHEECAIEHGQMHPAKQDVRKQYSQAGHSLECKEYPEYVVGELLQGGKSSHLGSDMDTSSTYRFLFIPSIEKRAA